MNTIKNKSALMVFLEYYLSVNTENNYGQFIKLMDDYPLNDEISDVKSLAIEKNEKYGEAYFNVALSSCDPEEIAHFLQKQD